MHQSTDLTHAVTATGVTVLGVATGLSYDVLLAGFAGGLASLSFIEPQGVWQRIWTLTTATLVAGYTAPAALPWIASLSPEGAEVPVVFAGFTMGLFGQAIIPAIAHRIRQKIGQAGQPSTDKR